jgi:hypothetical protein
MDRGPSATYGEYGVIIKNQGSRPLLGAVLSGESINMLSKFMFRMVAANMTNLRRRIEMKKVAFFGVLLSLLFFFPACNKASPTSPGAAWVRSISVTSTSTTYKVGDAVTFLATAMMSDGSIRRITDGKWSSDNLSVATVDSNGLVTIVGNGTAKIIMAYGGETGSLSITVGDTGANPDVRGTWTGTYSIDGCNSSGDFLTAKFCDTHTGSGYPIELILKQDFNDVQGTIVLGDLSMTVWGTFGWKEAGTLTMDGDLASDPFLICIVTAFQSPAPGQITGTFNLSYTATGLTGSGQLTCKITSLTRTSTSTKADVSAFAGRQPVNVKTLPDLVNALRKR